MKKFLTSIYLICFVFVVFAQQEPINVIVFGAHPDDCDLDAGGTAILFAKMGHKVKFVSLPMAMQGIMQWEVVNWRR